MAVNYMDYRAGLGNVGSYQASAKPYLSSSIHVSSSGDIVRIDFPNVTRFVTIKNVGPDDGFYGYKYHFISSFQFVKPG